MDMIKTAMITMDMTRTDLILKAITGKDIIVLDMISMDTTAEVSILTDMINGDSIYSGIIRTENSILTERNRIQQHSKATMPVWRSSTLENVSLQYNIKKKRNSIKGKKNNTRK